MNLENASLVTFALQAFVTLFVIMDPPGATPIFLSVVKNLDAKARRQAAFLAAATSFGIITVFALFGRFILNYLHVSIEALQVAGGLLLLYTSLELLTGRDSGKSETADATVALVPIGTPLLAGPAAIVATMIFVDKAQNTTHIAGLALAIVAVHIVVALTLISSQRILKLIKETGVSLVARIAGLLLAAIAVQMIADALTALTA